MGTTLLLLLIRAFYNVLLGAILCLGYENNGVSRGRDGIGGVLRWLEENGTIKHQQASSLGLAYWQAGCKQVPCQGHRQRGGFFFRPYSYTLWGSPEVNYSRSTTKRSIWCLERPAYQKPKLCWQSWLRPCSITNWSQRKVVLTKIPRKCWGNLHN